MKRLPLIFLAAAICMAACSPASSGGHAVVSPDGTRWQTLRVERLPDLPTPRGSHRTVAIGDEIVLLGGQTDGFKPLETAEYYSKGVWHTVPMVYPHINGFAARLPDGRILLGGGSEEHFGIGQSFGAELYDPAAHSFTSVGIMSAKRSLPSALTLPDGRVVIAGNWYAADSWETWSEEGGFVPGDAMSPGWAEPYILPASADDIIVFGPWDTRGDRTGGRVEHLGGPTESSSLLEGCSLAANYYVFPEDYQIADYTYLIPMVVDSLNTPAILKVASGAFSLLELESPLVATGPHGNPLTWRELQVDRPARLAWAQGFDPVTGSMCFARIAYDATFDGGKASVTYYFAEQPGGFPLSLAKLLPGGRLVLAGGTGWKQGVFPTIVDNFKAYSSSWIFYTEPPQKAAMPLWAIVGCVLIIVGGFFLIIIALRRRRKEHEAAVAPAESEEQLRQNLMDQISTLVEEKELYRRKDIRITDLATELATNKTYVSLLLNNMSGESFTSMITRYRVQYAQRLMQEHPDMLLDDVASESGFASYTTFYRGFKTVTGNTPQEWKKG